jgi:SAM-dependent methyltransferase
VRQGERVLDLGCGTGNAAVAAARAGAAVTALDPAPRLLDVARERLAAEGADAEVVLGDAQNLPFADDSFDIVLSVFALIFVPDPERGIAETLRVLRPGGRAFVATWVPAGALDAMLVVLRRAIADATGAAGPRFPWSDRDAVAEIAGRHGASVSAHDGDLSYTADSAEAFFASNEEHHPMAVTSRPLLEAAGTYTAVREEAIAVLRGGNESPDEFLVTSPYRVLELTKAG